MTRTKMVLVPAKTRTATLPEPAQRYNYFYCCPANVDYSLAVFTRSSRASFLIKRHDHTDQFSFFYFLFHLFASPVLRNFFVSFQAPGSFGDVVAEEESVASRDDGDVLPELQNKTAICQNSAESSEDHTTHDVSRTSTTPRARTPSNLKPPRSNPCPTRSEKEKSCSPVFGIFIPKLKAELFSIVQSQFPFFA